MKECLYFFASQALHTPLSYTAQDHLSQGLGAITTHNGLNPPTLTISQENAL